MRILNRSFILALVITLVSGCQTMQTKGDGTGINKQQTGAILGAIAGGLLGSRVGDGKGRTLATILGVAGGAWLGSQIGAHLDAKDRAALETESAHALSSARDGQRVSWRSQESGASATLTPQNTRSETRDVTYLRDRRVEKVTSIKLIGDTYVATKTSNVRSGPSTDTSRVGSLRSGEEFTAVGQVTNKPWIMVAKNDVTVGYVYAPLVKPANTQEAGGLRAAVNLDEIDNQQPKRVEGVDLDGIDLDVEAVPDTVTANTNCRTMDYSINSADGKTEDSQFEACKGSDGAWEII